MSAVGDPVTGLYTFTAEGDYDIKPSTSGEAWLIFYIFASDSCDLYWTDGTNDINFFSFTGSGYFPLNANITTSHWIKVHASSGVVIGWSGVVSKGV